MPAKDLYHEAVKQALIKDGWTVTNDPLHIRYGGFDFYIDFGAEDLLGASKNGQKIAVEVKTFLGTSALRELHVTVGQLLNYRLVLAESDPERHLYLAIPEYIYDTLFETPFGKLVLEKHHIKLIVFDEQQEVITQWLS
ncbi:MAG: XisH family protein [Thiofilum sp.]|uniref:XisH family protein n=1 Tax=Thiofilum sp. TaxID=2212733 RepID=UPI0025DCAAE8|nr:XisH family protein [Thiofilum sp.]MBK8455143.1 XisH family protein [Thiofilum sp.]